MARRKRRPTAAQAIIADHAAHAGGSVLYWERRLATVRAILAAMEATR